MTSIVTKPLVIAAALLSCGLGAASCQLAVNSGTAGLECDKSGDCHDVDLGCVPTNADNPGSQRVCMPPPGDWQCKGKFYGDTACDCGCGFQDIDCVTLLASECAQDGNNCPQGQDPVADDNTSCQ